MNQQLTWPQVIDNCGDDFKQIATKQNLVTWAEESLFAKQSIDKNIKLQQCTIDTVRNSVINVAAIGLSLNPALGYAYLVPESVKVGNNYQNHCNLRVSFKGLLKIANDSGSILWVKAETVKESDTFEYKGPCAMPEHSMNPFGARGNVVGVYCIAKTHEGDILCDVMNANEINKIMAAAKTKNVWNNWYEEMAKKAIIKRASKQWPRKDQVGRLDDAVSILNELEGSETIEKDITPQINPEFVGRFHAAIQQADGVALVALMDDIKEATGYTQETYSDFITAQKELYKTVPRGEKGKTEEKFKSLINAGITQLAEGAKIAVLNQDDEWLNESILTLGDSEKDLWPILGDSERQYIKQLKGE